VLSSGIRRPTLFLLCGLPGSGKTTLARKLEEERRAVRLTPDEWLRLLFGGDRARADAHRTSIEGLQWEVAVRALGEGADVILDWGFWSRAERDDFRARARSLGALAEVRFLDATDEDLFSRLGERAAAPLALRVSADELKAWSRAFERPTPDELQQAAGDLRRPSSADSGVRTFPP
jgi:predicted kinase